MIDDKIEAAIAMFEGVEDEGADEIREFLAAVLRERQRDEYARIKWAGFLECVDSVEMSLDRDANPEHIIYNLKQTVPIRYRRG